MLFFYSILCLIDAGWGEGGKSYKLPSILKEKHAIKLQNVFKN